MAEYQNLTTRDRATGYAILGLGCVGLIAAAMLLGDEHPMWFVGLAAVVLGALVLWHTRTFGYLCPGCGAQFRVTMLQNFLAPNMADSKYLTCPSCKRKDWAKVVARRRSGVKG